MATFTYDNSSFTAISTVTMIMLSLALCVTIGNIIRHALASYTSIRKRSIISLFVLEIICILLLIVSLWLYADCEPILIFVMVMINLMLFFVFILIKETLMVYSSKFARENPQILDRIVEQANEKDKAWTQDHMNMMKNKVYPFEEIKCIKRFQISYAFVALCYYLEGTGRRCICCKAKMNSYKQAYKFHTCRNAIPLLLYVLLVPLSNIAEYIGEENGKFKDRKINFVVITRVFITILTVFCNNSSSIFFQKLQKDTSIFEAQHNIGAIIRIAQATINPYSQYETYQLLFVCIFSCLFAILTILQCTTLSSSVMEIHEEKSLVYQSRLGTEQDANKDNQECDRSHLSKSSVQLQNNGNNGSTHKSPSDMGLQKVK